MLSEADHRKIEMAVQAAEARTSGEIVCILSHEVSNYRETPLAWAAAASLLLPPLALLAGWRPGGLLDALTGGSLAGGEWTAGQVGAVDTLLAHSLESYAIVQVILFAIVAAIVAIPPVRRLLTPTPLKRHRVHRAAMQQFLATGLHVSAERTGVVIFASEADRRVELLADDAIHAAVGDVAWNAAVKAVQDGMKRHDPASGFVKAIQICGDALAEHFPSTGPHPNALSDRLLEL
jgi:putative membrane protein